MVQIVTLVNSGLATWMKTAVLHVSLHGYLNLVINPLTPN